MSNKIREYYNNLKTTQQKINNNYIVDGIKYPKDTKTDHQQFELFSDNHINYMTKLFNLFEVFHNWLEDNNVLYTLIWGNLLGYHRQNNQILWDDDIDTLLVDNKGIEFINNIWNNSNEIAKPIWDTNWIYKTITINEKKYLLLKMKFKTNWFKLLYNENIKKNKDNKDLGGIDITYKINERDFLNRDLSILNNYILDEKIVPIVKYGPILARVLTKEPSCKILNLYYSNWILKKKPELH
tara:strand:+ start:95 stop:814 length:720 start_codon:yes stop_codon:yes gene_type:complete